MSMPFVFFKCDRCAFKADSTVLWGSFSYQLSDGRKLAVQRELGWCRQCATVTAIEDLSDIDARKQLDEANTALVVLNGDGFWKAIKRRTNKGRKEIELWQSRQVAAGQRLDFLRQRSDPPRCLYCSSTDVARLSHPQRMAPRNTQTRSDSFIQGAVANCLGNV